MKQNKSYHFSARFTEKSKHLLEANSTKAKLSKGAYLEQLLINKPLVIIDALDKFIPEMKQQGKNLNQIATRLNMGQIINPDFNDILNLYKEIFTVLIKIQRGDFHSVN